MRGKDFTQPGVQNSPTIPGASPNTVERGKPFSADSPQVIKPSNGDARQRLGQTDGRNLNSLFLFCL